MLFGSPSVFAIECYHEPVKNDGQHVYGRMAIWIHGICLGDIDEQACMLNETALNLEGAVRSIPSLNDTEVGKLSDSEAYAFLNRALYEEDDRTDAEVTEDAKRFFKYDFLTNGGESFDRTKSFIAKSELGLRIMFRNESNEVRFFHIASDTFTSVVMDFLSWVKAEGRNTI